MIKISVSHKKHRFNRRRLISGRRQMILKRWRVYQRRRHAEWILIRPDLGRERVINQIEIEF